MVAAASHAFERLHRNAAVGVLLPPTAEVEERSSSGQGA